MQDTLRKQILADSIVLENELLSPDADIWLTLNCTSLYPEPVTAAFTFVLKQGDDTRKIALTEDVEPGPNAVEVVFSVKEALYWLPNGAGEAPVYEIMAGIEAEGEVQDVANAYAALYELEIYENRIAINGKALSGAVCITEKPLSEISDSELDEIKALGFCGILAEKTDSAAVRDKCAARGLLVFENEISPQVIRFPGGPSPKDCVSSAKEACGALARALAEKETPGVYYAEAAGGVNRFFVKRALAPAGLFADGGSLWCYNRSFRDFAGALETEDGTKTAVYLDPGETKGFPLSGHQGAVLRDKDGKELARVWLGEKSASPKLFVSRFRISPEEYRLAIAADGFAECVEIKTDTGVLSDNYFSLAPQESREIVISGCQKEPEISCSAIEL